MFFSLRRWRPRHVWLAWGVYWIGLFLLTIGPGIVAGIDAANGPENSGGFSVSFGSAGLALTVTKYGDTVWAISPSIFMIVLALAGPPLALWFAWSLVARPPRPVAPGSASDASLLDGGSSGLAQYGHAEDSTRAEPVHNTPA